MKTRIRIEMTWSISLVPGWVGAPFSTIESFIALAKASLESRFANYNAALDVTVIEDFESIARLKLVWDVDLDMVPGAWHQPEDHQKLAQSSLVDGIKDYGRKLCIDRVLRIIPLEDVVDHSEVFEAAERERHTLVDDDMPTYLAVHGEPTNLRFTAYVQVFRRGGDWFHFAGGPLTGIHTAQESPAQVFMNWTSPFNDARQLEPAFDEAC